MKVSSLRIPDLRLIEPQTFQDNRGVFFESFTRQKYQEAGLPAAFVQDNQSVSNQGVLRGLHYQLPPYAQGKLVQVVKGTVFDVVVDIRKNSPTFGQWESIQLSEETPQLVYVPEGFAHGFYVLSPTATFIYKCTQPYHPVSERAIRWDDPAIGIEWPPMVSPPLVSIKDAAAPNLKSAELP